MKLSQLKYGGALLGVLFSLITWAQDAGHGTEGHVCTARPDTCLLQSGDIIFQDLDSSPLCDAIEDVTEGYHGARFSHCGIIYKDNNFEPWVFEAYGDNVRMTRFSEFKNRSLDKNGSPKIMIARLKPEYSMIISSAVAMCFYLKGKPYDDEFSMKSDKFYCSEMVYECFRQANNYTPFFPLNKMTFKAKGSNEFNKVWVDYFNRIHQHIPEGEDGINPGAISRSDKIYMLPMYGYGLLDKAK